MGFGDMGFGDLGLGDVYKKDHSPTKARTKHRQYELN